ncbi:hypothetical protein AB0O90_02920 [Microbacterium testaceum]|uniref:hypothetical protein n=1 Tax=Microbacterium testaceum TaxID=2033 RepID=UPI00342ABCE7
MRRVVAFSRQVLTCAAIGFASGALMGALYVLVGWFPGAMATFAENQSFTDPRLSLLASCAMWAIPCGLMGFVAGAVIGAFRATAPPAD